MEFLGFIEATPFEERLADYLTDEEYTEFQLYLSENPEAGDVIAGTGGCRKIRWNDTRRGKGKRGGIRVIYYYLSMEGLIYLITVYNKDEKKDLTDKEKKAMAEIVSELKGV